MHDSTDSEKDALTAKMFCYYVLNFLFVSNFSVSTLKSHPLLLLLFIYFLCINCLYCNFSVITLEKKEWHLPAGKKDE